MPDGQLSPRDSWCLSPLPPFHRLQLKTFSSADERKKRERVSVEQLYQATSRRRLNDEEENLAGNEFDSTELILDYFKPNFNDIILV
jgi:hypothetical protein